MRVLIDFCMVDKFFLLYFKNVNVFWFCSYASLSNDTSFCSPSSHQYTLSFCHLSKHITGVSWFILFAHYLSLFCSWLNSVHLTRCTSSLYIVASLYQLRPFFFLWTDGESQKRNRNYWKNEMEIQNWRVRLTLKKSEIQMNV